jgi:hypothetical protein
MIWCAAFGCGIHSVEAQNRVPASSRMQTEIQRPRETRSEKREELSRKLVQRKNELRREEHEHLSDPRNSEARERTNNPK